MKKNLIFSLLAVLFISGLLSFTLVKTHAKKAPIAKARVAARVSKKATCSSVVSGLTQTGSFSFSWSSSGSPNHYNYGGYYQAGGTFSGTTTSTSVTIPSNSGTPKGGRISVTPVCADGSLGTPQNILFN
ncbi:hypothetical protein [Mucilaginibacter flavus]|uniref:hypothetical protein n=1 Tax=Mucilaginibacter flavus TaxID=931504 RepID=UPI0025B48A30|nr:hypothetical protein [Mucilaginibacter flavus]MDN3579843.1 hypothetical protein [Mucilaginibacter flavus]